MTLFSLNISGVSSGVALHWTSPDLHEEARINLCANEERAAWVHSALSLKTYTMLRYQNVLHSYNT